MAELRPWRKEYDPIGTPEELAAANLSPDSFGSCSKRGPGNLGCRYWNVCDLSCRGQGPRNFGVRIAKPPHNGSSVHEVQKVCYHIIEQREQLRDNGTVMRIVAKEGDTIHVMGSTATEESKRRNPKEPIYEDFERDVVVAAFPRPNENKAIKRLAYAARMQKREQQEREFIMESLTTGDEFTDHMDLRHLSGRERKEGAGAVVPAGAGGKGKPDEGRPAKGNP